MANWSIPEASQLKYADVFKANDHKKTNFLNGTQAKSILLESGLTEKILSQIWTLADVDNDGQLSAQEFILAMHLIDTYKAGQELPVSLSYDLLPRSLDNTSPSSSIATTTDSTVRELNSDLNSSQALSSRVNDSPKSGSLHNSRDARSNSSSWNCRPSSGGKRNNCDLKNDRESKTKERRQSRYTPRPGYCEHGSKISLFTNHYYLSIPDKFVYMYDLSITPIRGPRNAKATVYELILDDKLKTRFVREYGQQVYSSLLRQHSDLFESKGKSVRCVYDGARTVYSCKRLQAIDCQVKNHDEKPIIIESDGPSFEVKLKFAAQVDLKKINDFVRGKVHETPQEPLKAVEIIINYALSQNMVQVQRSFFPQLGSSTKPNFISNDKLIVSGHSQSCKITQCGPTLNVDRVSTIFHSSGPVLAILESMLGEKVSSFNFASNNVLNAFKALNGLKAFTNHGFKRSFKLKEMTVTSARDQYFTMKDDNGQEFEISVEEYFKRKYKIDLKYPDAFCIKSGSLNRPVYYPIEVIEIAPNQPAKRITPLERTSLIRENSRSTPKDRLNSIEDSVEMIKSEASDIFKNFSISLNSKTIKIEGYRLNHPVMKYGKKNDHEHSPSRLPLAYGKWEMNDRKVLTPSRRLKHLKWIVVNLSKYLFRNEKSITTFINKLIERSREMGMKLPEPIRCAETGLRYFEPSISPYLPYSIGFILDPIFKQIALANLKVDFILFFFEDKNDTMYRDIKYFCDVERGINNQCIACKNVLEMDTRSRRHLFANILLQINTKLGGINGLPVKSRDLERILNKRTLILGADVSHPTGLDTLTDSISSVTASMDNDHYFYECSIRVSKKLSEVIRCMQEMVYSLLKSYHEQYRDRRHPERIIFFRDGVSESMFDITLSTEVKGIRDACKQYSPEWRPAITVIVAQKRHSTRLFSCEDISKNVASGTLVDSKITHPCDFDYYLCSHDSRIGTSRPTHYTVILDENYISPETLYDLTFHLCHTYAPATRSISIPAPILYAHLSAKRTRHHLLCRGSSHCSEQKSFCHDRVKSKMYFI